MAASRLEADPFDAAIAAQTTVPPESSFVLATVARRIPWVPADASRRYRRAPPAVGRLPTMIR
jgi:hypothetical protein